MIARGLLRHARLRPSGFVEAAFRYESACLAEAGGASEGWRPGLDLNQDEERCTALA